MRTAGRWIGLVLLIIAGGSAPWVRAAGPEVYGRLPTLEDVRLSPEGTRIAFVRTEGDTR